MQTTNLTSTAKDKTPELCCDDAAAEKPRAPSSPRFSKRVDTVAELRAFVNEHADEIRQKATILTYGRRELADEVLQELYPRLVTVLGRNPHGIDNVWAVIHTVAARLAIDVYRKHRRSLRTKQLLEPGELTDCERPPPELPDSDALRHAMATLPHRLQIIVSGIFIEGCKAKDIARRVGLSESRVAELKAVALKQLRQALS